MPLIDELIGKFLPGGARSPTRRFMFHCEASLFEDVDDVAVDDVDRFYTVRSTIERREKRTACPRECIFNEEGVNSTWF